jgi:[acyl-carrier-protein] S-malonyltransferase
MKPAQDQMSAELDSIEFSDLRYPLINNWQAREIRTAAEAKEGLLHQIPSPVMWTQTVRYLASAGVIHCFEVGAGSVLTGLLRSIDPALKGTKFGEAGDLEKVHAATATA